MESRICRICGDDLVHDVEELDAPALLCERQRPCTCYLGHRQQSQGTVALVIMAAAVNVCPLGSFR